MFCFRKPLFYMFNLVLPAVFITATTILVFYLPAASGEKVSLGVTVLLALTVFLLMVAESTPPQSDSIPLMGKYIMTFPVIYAFVNSTKVKLISVKLSSIFGQCILNFFPKNSSFRQQIRHTVPFYFTS